MKDQTDFATEVAATLAAIRAQQPLVHNITNFVAMNTSANALLALGASPIMAHAPEELQELSQIVHALVINIGTLNADWIAAMKFAAHCAGQRQIPIVLDPVGAGASRIRTQTALDLLAQTPVSIIRANASEIKALAGEQARNRGVDATDLAADAVMAGRRLSQQFSCVVSISGPQDYIIDQTTVFRLSNGHPMMPRVTTLGCTASALTGAAAAVCKDSHHAAATAMVIMGIAGEIAAEQAAGPGSLQLRFLDALYQLTADDISSRLRWAVL